MTATGTAFLKIQEVADLFSISRSTAFRMMQQQGWPRHQFGGETRFSDEAARADTLPAPGAQKVEARLQTC
ncbi:DNA-binding protein [Arthrobacter sp. RT-1]|nr:DNA-binding protein [Arthrobacter sp. RT-1]